MTNADKIRNMTNDELRCFLEDAIECGGITNCQYRSQCILPFCQHNIGKWLNEEVIETKIFQFSYESSEAENGVASITYELSGTEEALNNAEILWLTTIDLSNAKYHNNDTKHTKQFLVGDGWSDEDIEFIFAHFPNGVSSDPITAYGQCLEKIKELGLTVKELEDSDKADVWASYGVY